METTAQFGNQTLAREVEIIPRKGIPAIHSVLKEGSLHEIGELRDFLWHDSLNEFIPSSLGISFSWVRLKAGEILSPHAHPIKSMIIITKGKGKITGQKNLYIDEGDVAIIPPGCAHGFECVDNEGFSGISIQFDGGLYTKPESAKVEFLLDDIFTFQNLLDYNQQRLKEFTERAFFTLIQDGTLEDEKKREIFLASLEIWVSGNQTLLFARQGTCHDLGFKPTFLKHLQEEVGHDDLYNENKQKSTFKDVGMTAVTAWFLHQMFVLDNIEKAAIIHLVIESASDEYHKIAKPYLSKYINDAYFQAHEGDVAHIAMGQKLLDGYNSKVYKRLHEVIEEAWDMLNSMVDRVTFLVQSA